MNIDFHFDFLSPYAYLAWTQIHGLAARHGATVTPIPTLFAALLAHGGTKGPAEIPAKRAYVFLDTLRSARALGVPLVPPPAHPFHPLLALRVCTALEGETQKRAIDALYAAAWGGEGGCDTEERVVAALMRAGLDASALIEGAQSEEVKSRLRVRTETAIANGVFGVPTMRTGATLASFFFGLDSFPALERHLRGEDLVVDDDLRTWAHLPVGASRKG